MTNTHNFAARELSILSASHPDPTNRPLIEPFKKEILALCEKFGQSGQSGGSGPYTALAISQAIKILLLKEPICPVTGLEEEWVEVADDNGKPLFQNSRCSALFKVGVDGDPYYLDAIVWKNQNGFGYSGSALMPDGKTVLSRATVKSFPFTPKTFYINVIEEEVAPDDWIFHVKDVKQLKRVEKLYKLNLSI